MRTALLSVFLVAGAARAEPPAPARELPKLEVTVADDEAQVASVTGDLQAERTHDTSDMQAATAAAPDFVLHVKHNVSGLRIEIFGVAGDTRVLLGGAKAYLESGHRMDVSWSSRLPPGDYGVWIGTPREAKGPFTALVFQREKVSFAPTQRYGEPAPDSPVKGRALAQFLPYFAGQGCGAATAADADIAHQLFTSLPPSFFVFTDHRLGGSNGGAFPPGPGEPFLYKNRGYILTHDGVCFSASDSELTTQPPEKLSFPAIRPLHIVPAKEQNNLWNEEDFLAVADKKAADAYRAKKKKAFDCYDKVWDKLDPDHNASRYDVATVQNGRVARVEGLADRFDRKASAQCKLNKVWSERDKLEKTTLTHLDTQRKTWLADVEQHVAELQLAH